MSFSAEARALRAHDHGRHAFAEIGMRHADDGAFDDARHTVDLGLDFFRIDVGSRPL